MRGYRLTNSQSINMLFDEIINLPKDFESIITPLTKKNVNIQNGKTSITTRLNGQVKSLYKKTYISGYYDE